jgi:hypothetical protein
MNWKRYFNAAGEYAERGTLVLCAYDNGAWSVHDREMKMPSKSSYLAPIVGPYDLSTAKAKAIEAADRMASLDPTKPLLNENAA